jgi:IclR family acetate operon transcriptional repressor
MLQSVTTALKLFEYVAKNQPIGVSDIARGMGITKSTAQRCLNALESNRWLRKESDTAKWVITSKAFSIGQRAAGGDILKKAAWPVMEKLRNATRETIHLVIPEGRNGLLLEQLESPELVRIFIPLNAQRPMHFSANGKVMLAYMSEKYFNQYVAHGLEVATEYTVKDPDELKKQLRQVLQTGYCISIDELVVGASAIAAPVFDGNGVVIGSISVSSPTSRLPKSIRPKFGRMVSEAALEITRRMGE